MSTKIQGHCKRCQAPIFLNQCTDWFGNTVVSLNCWNGHYAWIDIENIAEDIEINPEKSLVAFIGFFNAP